MILAAGTKLYRGIDTPTPNNPLRLNCEAILWVAKDSATAQTYIPDWGHSAYFPWPWYSNSEIIRPDDGINTMLIEQCGGKLEISSRDNCNRPTSWSCNQRITWGNALELLEKLGYSKEESGAKVNNRLPCGSGFLR
jgi:hypothetical protein